MSKKEKTFVVSVADFAYYVGDKLACTGKANLNTSLEVSMQEKKLNAGKGNQLVYSLKYGREIKATLESADWKLEFIAMQVGSPIAERLSDVYSIGECVDIVGGVGTLKHTPVGDVSVQIGDGTIVTVTPKKNTIDLNSNGITSGVVDATYRFDTQTRMITIDGSTTPMVGKLILDADKHSNERGKIGSVQVIIPSYQLDGNFSINFTPDGIVSTSMAGNALAVEGDKCSDGSSVYAYIKEFGDEQVATTYESIVAVPSVIKMKREEDVTIKVIGLKGGITAPVQIDNDKCTFKSEQAQYATVSDSSPKGVVHGASAGKTYVTVTFGQQKDVIEVTVS